MNKWAGENPEKAVQRTQARARATIIGRAVRNVTDLFTDDDLRRVADVVRESLDAETAIVVPCGKGEADVEHVPDHKTRLDAAKLVMAYTDGLPVARQMIIHGDFRDLDAEKRAVLVGSSAIQEALTDLGQDEVGLENLEASE